MSAYTELDWYDTPLYYDIVFAGDEQRECEFLEGLLERYGPKARRRRRILEPACGSGRLVLELARRGHDVWGFDLNEQMLEFARQRLARARRKAHLFQARLEDFEAPREFDLAHCLVNTFKYLLDEASVQRHLRAVASALRPGGLYVIGLHLTEYEDRRCNHERWNCARDGVEVTCNIRGWPADAATRLERVRSRLSVREAGRERRSQTEWSFRTYDWEQFAATLRRARDFELAAAFDFTYDLSRERSMPDDQLDIVAVLRRRGAKS